MAEWIPGTAWVVSKCIQNVLQAIAKGNSQPDDAGATEQIADVLS